MVSFLVENFWLGALLPLVLILMTITGAVYPAIDLTAGEREICAALAPELKRRGLLFVGIDVIGGKWLTEINVTSPTGIVAVDQFNGSDTPGLIWQAIERKLAG